MGIQKKQEELTKTFMVVSMVFKKKNYFNVEKVNPWRLEAAEIS